MPICSATNGRIFHHFASRPLCHMCRSNGSKLGGMENNFLAEVKNHRMQAWNGKKQARWYARDVNNDFTFEDIDLDTQIDAFQSLVPTGSRVADIGCGTGALTLKLASLGYDMTGFDSSLPMLDQLRKRTKGRPITLQQADIFLLDESFGLFDAAVSRWVLSHFPDWGQVLVSVGRLLRPGGIFVFEMKSKEHRRFASSAGAVEDNPELMYAGEGLIGDFDPLHVVTDATAEEIEVVVNNAGFELLFLRPFGLFASNKLLARDVGSKDLEKRVREVNSLLRKSEHLRGLIKSLETNLAPHLPQHLLFRTLVVARLKE